MLGGGAKISSCEASGKIWEPPIELWVSAPRLSTKKLIEGVVLELGAIVTSNCQ